VPTEDSTPPSTTIWLRSGDASARANDWVAAVANWQRAATDGDVAARHRLRGFLQHYGVESLDQARVPRRALQPLAICLEAAVFGLLAAIAANQTGDRIDPILLAIAWIAWTVSAIAGLVFAARSGRLDNDVAATVAAMPIETVISKATLVAARIEPATPEPTLQPSSSVPAGDPA